MKTLLITMLLLYQTALIGGIAYNDHNANGKQNTEDEYLNGIKVNLFQDGKVVASTITNKNGAYQFEVDKNAKYYVEFEVKDMNVSQLGTKKTVKDNDTNNDFKTSSVLVTVGKNNFVDFDGAFNKSVPLTPITPIIPPIPTNPNDKILDTDGDGLSDEVEIEHGFNPYHKDTDNDGISDYDEFMKLKGNVLDKITNNIIVNTGNKYANELIISLVFTLGILIGIRRNRINN